MAKYDTLPIYQVAYKMTIDAMTTVSNLPKEYKYSLGERIQSAVLDVLVSIYKANASQNKISHLKNLQESLQLFNLLIRISSDLRVISTKEQANFIELATDVYKQSSGWLKTYENMPEPVHATV